MSFVTAIIFLIIAAAMLIIWLIYIFLWRPTTEAPACSNDSNCGITQVCQAGFCAEKLCSTDANCDGNGLCINSYCVPFNCTISNDCPGGSSCIDGNCVKTGGKCKGNADCQSLSCTNGVCVECTIDSSCPTGQGCFNNTCRYPYSGQTGLNLINYPSPAQSNGNIAAPPGYFCPVAACGTGPTGDVINCISATDCPGNCSSCVNSVCRCTKGQLTEHCADNADCESGLCRGNVCVGSGGQCTSNYDGTTGIIDLGSCPISSPYCVDGLCSPVSLGAACGATGQPEDLCNNLQALGIIGQTGISPDGMGLFCVNGRCQSTPGNLNQLCTPGSCLFVENEVFVCVPEPTPSILQSRCQRGSLI
jgi:hypothetical protein